MKNIINTIKLLVLLQVTFLYSDDIQEEPVLLDEITFKTPYGITTASDSWLPSPLGMIVPQKDLIMQEILVKNAYDRSIIQNMQGLEQYADQYLKNIQKERKISYDQIEKMCKDIGYSIADLKKSLTSQYIMQQSMEVIASAFGAFHVSYQEIYDYITEHPKIEEALYTFQKGVSVNSNPYNYEDPFTLKESALSKQFKISKEKEVGSIIFEKEEENSHIIYKLIKKIPEKRFSPESVIEDEYENISKIIQNKKYQQAYTTELKKLIEEEDIYFKYDSQKKEIIDDLSKRKTE